MKESKDELIERLSRKKTTARDREWVSGGVAIDLGTRAGYEEMRDRVLEEIPPYSNRGELCDDYICSLYIDRIAKKDRIVFIIDLSISLSTSPWLKTLKSEYKLRQMVPDLENIIRKIVKQELNK